MYTEKEGAPAPRKHPLYTKLLHFIVTTASITAICGTIPSMGTANAFLTIFLCSVDIQSGKPQDDKDHKDDDIVGHTATLTFLLAVAVR